MEKLWLTNKKLRNVAKISLYLVVEICMLWIGLHLEENTWMAIAVVLGIYSVVACICGNEKDKECNQNNPQATNSIEFYIPAYLGITSIVFMAIGGYIRDGIYRFKTMLGLIGLLMFLVLTVNIFAYIICIADPNYREEAKQQGKISIPFLAGMTLLVGCVITISMMVG